MGHQSISHGKFLNYPREITRFPLGDFLINKLFAKINLLFIRKHTVVFYKRPDVWSERRGALQSKPQCFEVKATFTLQGR